MRELDVLLEGWLRDGWPRASSEEKTAFRALLELADPELAAYLLRGERHPDPATQRLVARLRGDD